MRYSELWSDAPQEGGSISCPECGEDLGLYDQVYTLRLSDHVAGCSNCLNAHNALDWFEANR